MIFLADLPPPVHGMSKINQAMLQELEGAGLKLEIINTVPSLKHAAFNTNAWLALKVLHTLCSLLNCLLAACGKNHRVIYRPINGGAGQVFDLFYLLIFRAFGKYIYIHHHSFSYLNRKSFLFWMITKLLGSNSTHIVLGEAMSRKLIEKYSIPSHKIKILSNTAFFVEESLSRTEGEYDEKKLRIGHLSNLSIPKGVSVFCALCYELMSRGVSFTASIAGPFADEDSLKQVTKACTEIPQLNYVGPLYGSEKDEFFKNIDCFIFPSRYKNEAEPLVIYEAAQSGGHVIGSAVGCMEGMLKSLGGVCIDSDDERLWVSMCIEFIVQNETMLKDREQRAARVTLLHKSANKSKDMLLELISEIKRAES